MDTCRDQMLETTEAETAAAERRLSSILAAAPIGIEIVDPKGTTIFSAGTVAESSHVHSHRFQIDANGESYALALTLDDSERQAREQELIRRAYFDELTGLPNRALF